MRTAQKEIPKAAILEIRGAVRSKGEFSLFTFTRQAIRFLNGSSQGSSNGQFLETKIVAVRVWLLAIFQDQPEFVFAMAKRSIERIRNSWAEKLSKAFRRSRRITTYPCQASIELKRRKFNFAGAIRHFQSGR